MPKKPKQLNIVPIKTSKKKVLHNNFNIIPSFPHRTLFVAPTGSGKSVVIVNLLTRKRYLRNFFNKIIFYSPNVNYEEEHLEIKLKNLKTDIQFEEQFKPKEFKTTIDDIMNKQKQLKDDKKPMKRILIIIDDFASDKKVMKSKILKDLFFAGRKYNISVWITTQYYKIVPPDIRTNAEHLIIFAEQPTTELEKITEEISIGSFTKKKLKDIFNDLSKERFNFLHYNRKQPINQRFMMKFKYYYELD